ncbi:hypothetical protein CH330_04390 [candidate division WOR-3 bacterium JGI_Cruoil_03_51_56]|uniref:Lipopolysaccharide assembly protein A domain-containing protein n=1 Tax=candidate division WOR-3 bacterium JGI_Cruoil_03_51_56 TaxID=1973747 RepID=A0A235BUB7_UNCW3|nr:MAG: hypothetical protein CH330_04390 [candidate division WOR-3 bacterium JGI_Cruoil_03_51_56]
MDIFRIILTLIIFILLLVLALTNIEVTTSVNVFGTYYEHVRVAFVMLYAFAFGAICVGVFMLVSEIQLHARIRRQHREINAITEELRSFRNASLEPMPQDTEAENQEDES